MQIIKQIKVSDIPGILDDYLRRYRNGEIQYANVAFYAPEAFGRSRNIEGWFDSHKDCVNVFDEIYPGLLYENHNGILEKNKNGMYVIADSVLEQVEGEQGAVLFYRRLNWGRDFNAVPELYQLIANRKYKNKFSNIEYDLTNVFLTVATLLPDSSCTNKNDILSDLFDIYEVTATFKDTVEYLIGQRDEKINEIQAELNKPADDVEMLEECLSKCTSQKAILEQIAQRDVNILHSAAFPPIFVNYALEVRKGEGSFAADLKNRLTSNDGWDEEYGSLNEILSELKKTEDI